MFTNNVDFWIQCSFASSFGALFLTYYRSKSQTFVSGIVCQAALTLPRSSLCIWSILKMSTIYFSGLHGNNGYSDSRMSDTVNTSRNSSIWKSLRKKYVLLCCLCGGLCLALGILYLVIYFVLGRYTSSLHYFQSLPLYIPSIVVRTPKGTFQIWTAKLGAICSLISLLQSRSTSSKLPQLYCKRFFKSAILYEANSSCCLVPKALLIYLQSNFQTQTRTQTLTFLACQLQRACPSTKCSFWHMSFWHLSIDFSEDERTPKCQKLKYDKLFCRWTGPFPLEIGRHFCRASVLFLPCKSFEYTECVAFFVLATACQHRPCFAT